MNWIVLGPSMQVFLRGNLNRKINAARLMPGRIQYLFPLLTEQSIQFLHQVRPFGSFVLGLRNVVFEIEQLPGLIGLCPNDFPIAAAQGCMFLKLEEEAFMRRNSCLAGQHGQRVLAIKNPVHRQFRSCQPSRCNQEIR